MKGLLFFVSLAVVNAELPLPRYHNAKFRFQRQELSPGESEREATTPSTRPAPYPPAGWRPAKEFKLPTKISGPPATSYGVPITSYSAPQNEYGVPTESTFESTTSFDPTTTSDVESLKVKGLQTQQSSRQTAAPGLLSNSGAYYVLLPDSRLQRVEFKTENDLRNMAYTAQLKYRDEDRAPIFIYTGTLPQSANYASSYSAPVKSAAAAYIQFV